MSKHRIVAILALMVLVLAATSAEAQRGRLVRPAPARGAPPRVNYRPVYTYPS